MNQCFLLIKSFVLCLAFTVRFAMVGGMDSFMPPIWLQSRPVGLPLQSFVRSQSSHFHVLAASSLLGYVELDRSFEVCALRSLYFLL
mmetsp:Transcript_1123/g.2231  ORF Transcript_1123/g.2231 Transcript_1123/m.2231 type:complete len:87 (+) Transcript_1123:190-450(+)